jgi:hypothetical protein
VNFLIVFAFGVVDYRQIQLTISITDAVTESKRPTKYGQKVTKATLYASPLEHCIQLFVKPSIKQI